MCVKWAPAAQNLPSLEEKDCSWREINWWLVCAKDVSLVALVGNSSQVAILFYFNFFLLGSGPF